MKKIFSAIVAATLFVSNTSFWVKAENEAVIHVSTDGKSAATGSENDPVDSLNTALELVKNYSGENVRILIHKGTYAIDNTLSIKNSETHLSVETYSNDKVIFTGANTLNNKKFKQVTDAEILERIPREARTKVMQYDLSGDGLNYSKYDSCLPYLYVNDVQATMARYPNDGHLIAAAASGGRAFEFSEYDVSKWEKATDMMLCGSTGATYFWYTTPAGVSDSVITADITVRKNTKFYVENLIEEIDVPGEYAIDRENDILYYYPKTDIADCRIELTGFMKNAVEIENSANITFDGLTFEKIGGRAFSVKNGDNVIIKNCNINYISGDIAINFSGNNSKITDNTFYGCAGNVITFHGGSVKTLTRGNVEVTNNRISYCGFRDRMSIITSGSSSTSAPSDFGNKVNNNLIQDCMTFMSIAVNANDYEIKNNEIVNQGYWIGDGGAIYMGRSNVKYGTEVAYNYIHEGHRNDPSYAYCGIYSDDGYGGANFHHNVVADMYQGMIVNFGANGKLNNNLFINNSHPFGMGAVMTSYTPEEGAVENGNQDLMYNEANKIINKTTYGKTFSEYYPLIEEGLSRKPYFAPWNTEATGNVTIYGSNTAVKRAYGSRPWHPYYKKDGKTVVISGEEELVASNPEALKYGKGYIGLNLFEGYYVDVLSLFGAKVTDDDGNDLNATELGNPAFEWNDEYFKDSENQDYTLTDAFSCDVSTVKEIDMSKMSIQNGTNKNAINNNPKSVELLSPKNNEENVFEKVNFTWDRVKNASKYRLVVAEDEDLKEVLIDETFNDSADSMVKTKTLKEGKRYYWQITAYGIAKNDSYEAKSDIYSFTTRSEEIYNRESFEYAEKLLKQQIKYYNDGLIDYRDESVQPMLEALAENIEEASTQEALNNIEDEILSSLIYAAQYVNDINSDITECRVDKESDDVYVTGTGFGKNKNVSVMVTNPGYGIDSSAADLMSIQYIDTIKSDKNGIISFKFNTRVDNEDRNGIYTLYIKSETGKIITKKYSYGTISAGEIIYKNSEGEVIEDISQYSGKELTLYCDIENGTDIEITPCVITSFYNGGVLKQVSCNTENSVGALENKTIDWKVMVWGEKFDKAQVMFWDSLINLKPLTKQRVIYEVKN